MTNYLLAGIAGLFLSLNLLPFLPVDWWWVRWWEFPRTQLFIVDLVIVAAILGLRWSNPWFCAVAVMLVFCSAWQAWWVFPFTPLASRQTQAATDGENTHPQFRVLAANVRRENRTSGPIIEMIQATKPDVLVLTEIDHWWLAQLQPVIDDFPEKITQPQDNHYGMAVFSRLPITKSEIRYLVNEEIPSIHLTLQLSDGHEIRFVALHPAPPLPKFSASERDAELVLAGREFENSQMPTVVAGDLNDVGWSETTRLFQRISGMLDPRRGRGIYSTFHAKYPFARWPLDHLFHTEQFRLVEMRVMPDIGSDHFPLLIELSYEPEHSATQPTPAKQADDDQAADETIKEGREDEAEGDDGSESRATELEG